MAVQIDGTTGIDKVQDGSIVNADIAAGAAIDASKLANLPDNTPAFMAYTAGVNTAGSTWARVNWELEAFDTDGCFDSAAEHRFQPNVAGKYYLSCVIEFSQIDSDTNAQIAIRKNGSEIGKNLFYPHNPGGTGGGSISAMPISMIVDANGTTDYFEIYVYQTSGVRVVQSSSISTYSSNFSGFRIAGA